MLWSIKRHVVGSLLLLALFVGVSLGARQMLGIPGTFHLHDGFLIDFALCLSLVLANDFGFHTLLWKLAPGFYPKRYRALVEYFRGQRAPHFVTSGLLAAGEELLFRGTILEGLRSVAGLPVWAAVGIAALAFGLAHVPRQRILHWFGVMAFWEGIVLGVVYVYTDSVLFVMVFHFVHDTGGYAFFDLERRRGIWLGKQGS